MTMNEDKLKTISDESQKFKDEELEKVAGGENDSQDFIFPIDPNARIYHGKPNTSADGSIKIRVTRI